MKPAACPFRTEAPQCPEPALFVGTVRHRRLSPRRHAFRYEVFQALLDLDRLDEAAAASRLVSRNRFNWLSIDDRDFLPDRPEATLKGRFEAAAREAGHALPEGARVYLLANLRTLGLCFNPVSYYYAYGAEGRLLLVCAEVTNTPWRERHRYWMDAALAAEPGGRLAFEVSKAMHVSPFMPMGLRYRWVFSPPGERLMVHMGLFEGGALRFDATLDLARRPWAASEIQRTLVRFPWITLKVIAAIHWEAFRLWIKRVPVFTHPKKLRPAS